MTALEQLLNSAKEVKQVRQSLINSLSDVEDEILKILEEAGLTDADTLEKLDYNGFGIRLLRSNVGAYHRITKIGTGTMINYNNLGRGKDFYYHGDFNASYRIMTRQETLSLANSVKGFIDNMVKVMSEIAKEEAVEITSLK